jgi:hypothetical protein
MSHIEKGAHTVPATHVWQPAASATVPGGQGTHCCCVTLLLLA